MIVVHGRASSSNVQKVLWLLDELGLPFERIDRGGRFGGLDDPDYRALNPNSRVPTVVDGDLVMWESNAILRHYSRTHVAVFPGEPGDAVRADMLLDWNTTTLWPAVRPPYWAVAVEGAPRDAPDVQDGLSAILAELAILEDLLAGRTYAAGERFTIADIPLAISVDRWRFLGGTLEPFPALEAWHARCRARPGFAARVFPR